MQLMVLLLSWSDPGDDHKEEEHQSHVKTSQAQLMEHMPRVGIELLSWIRIVLIFTGIVVGSKVEFILDWPLPSPMFA
jgi:hypothetical protein